jgi:hypothetical protein
MSVIISNRAFTPISNGVANTFPLLATNDIVNHKFQVKANYDFEATTQNSVIVSAANQLTITGTTWFNLGYQAGDSIDIAYTNPSNGTAQTLTATITSVSLSGTVITLSASLITAAINQVYPYVNTFGAGTFEIENNTASVNFIDVLYNWQGNTQPQLNNSVVDGEVNRVNFNVSGMSVSDVVSGVQVGNKSGGELITFEIEKLSADEFEVRTQLFQWIDEQSLFPLRLNVTVQIRRDSRNPNGGISQTDSVLLGNVGFYNQNYFAGVNPFVVADFDMKDVDDNPLTAPLKNALTKISGKITGTGTFEEANFLFKNVFFNPSQYQNKPESYLEIRNGIFESDSENIEFGGFEVVSSSFDLSIAGEVEFEVVIEPNSTTAAYLETISDVGAVISLTVATDDTDNRTCLLLYNGQMGELLPVGQDLVEKGLLTSATILLHDGTRSNKLLVEDDVLISGGLSLVKGETYNSFTARVQVVRDSDGASFDLWNKTINLQGFPVSLDGKQLINHSSSTGFNMPNPNRNENVMFLTGVENSTTYGVNFQIPFLVSWRYWNVKPQAFVDFLNTSLPQNGLNDNWARYIESGYSFQIRLELASDVTDFHDSQIFIDDYDVSPNVTSDITIHDMDGNLLPTIVSNQPCIVRATHTIDTTWVGVINPWAFLAIRTREQDPRTLISSVYDWQSSNNPLSPLTGEVRAVLDVTGAILTVEARILAGLVTEDVTIVSRVGESGDMQKNVHKREVDISRLPIQATCEDRGYNQCAEPLLALSDPNDCDCQWKNDVLGISLIAESITIELERPNGELLTGLGAVVNFPMQDNAVGFLLDWRSNLIAYGAGCYRVRVNYVINGVSGYYYYGTYDLYPYSIEISEGTVQLFANYDDFVRNDGINYTGSGFYTSVRVKGFFGNKELNSEHLNILKGTNIREKVRNFAAPSYTLRTRPLYACALNKVEHILMAACNLWITDFNAFNHECYKYFNVIIKEDSGIELDGDETPKRWLECQFNDKLWKTESKYYDKQGSPPLISQIIACNGGGGVCPSLCELISENQWETIKDCLSEQQIEDAQADICGIPPCDPATVQINGEEVATVASGGMVNIAVENESGTPLGAFDEETGVWVVPDCPPPSNPQGGMLPFKTGQTTVYETGDDGTTQRGTPFFTLPFNNPYSNTTRFLDTLGGTTYANGITLDLSTTQWTSPTTGTFMGYVYVNVNAAWATQAANALAATHGGYSGWSIINDRELISLSVDNGSVNNSLNHSGLLVPDTFALWTGKTNTNATAQAIQRTSGGIINAASKANSGRRIDARLFNFSIVGGTVILS